MATLSGNKIKDTYQSLIKLTDNGNLTTGAKQLTDGFGNNSPLYISTTQIGIGVTPEATYDLHVYSNAKVGGNLTVTGDLTVEGTTTTIDTQTLTVEDPLIEVASNNTSTDAVDIGWYGKYAPSGTTLYAGLFRDTGDSKFKLFRNLEEQPTTTVNTSGTGYTVATLVADLEGTLTGVIASTTTATTQTLADNSTKVATTAYVDASIGNSTLAEVLANGDTTGGGNIVFGDSDVFLTDDTLMFGASNDLVIYHDGSNSFIRERGTGNLYIDGETSISLRKYTGAENMLVANTDGAVELYYDASKKFETSSTGVVVYGVAQVDELKLSDSEKILLGTGDDLEIYHDGLDGYIYNNTGTLKIHNEALADIIFRDSLNDRLLIKSSGAVELNYAGSKKLETTSSGATVSGLLTVNGDGAGNVLSFGLDKIIQFNTSLDFYDLNGLDTAATIEVDGITADTFNGQLVGTISSSTTATTQTQGDNSTKVATTAYVDTAVGNNNELSEVLSNGNTTGGTDIVITSGDKITNFTSTGIDDNATSTALTIDSSGVVDIIGGILDMGQNRIDGSSDNLKISADNSSVSGSSTIEFLVDGDEKMRINNSGNVGINEINPDARLHIGGGNVIVESSNNGGVDTNNNIILKDTDTTASSGQGIGSIQFYGSDASGAGAGIKSQIKAFYASNGNSSLLSFHTSDTSTNNTERMRIDSSGNVGINETNPDTILHISDGNTSDPSTNAPVIRLQNTSENCFNLFTDGDVIGGLEFYNDEIFCTDIGYPEGVNAYFRAVHDGGNNPTPRSSLEFGTGTGGSASTKMLIDSSGNVGIGIGTTNPTEKLEIAGDVKIQGADSGNAGVLHFGNDSDQVKIAGFDSGGSSVQNTLFFFTNSTERMRIDSDGNIGVGVEPESWATVGGTKAIQISTGGALWEAYNGVFLSNNIYFDGANKYIASQAAARLDLSSTGELKFFNAPSGTADTTISLQQRLHIDSSGQVGIGTNSPQTLLDIHDDSPVLRISATNQSASWVVGTEIGKLEFYTTDPSGNAPYDTGFISIENDFAGGTLPSGAMIFGTATYNASGGAIERMRIDSSGNVGINETNPDTILHITKAMSSSPTSNIYLDVSGTNTNGGGGSIIFNTSATAGTTTNYNAAIKGVRDSQDNGSSELQFFTTHQPTNIAAQERMRIGSSGNVRFTGTAPNSGDEITQLNFYNTSSSLNLARITGIRQAGGTNYGALTFSTTNSGTLSEKMRIDSSGDVSIGNAASFGKLRVGHIGDNTNALVIGDASTPANDTGIYMRSDTLGVISVGSTASFSFRTGGGSGTERMRIHSDGIIDLGDCAQVVPSSVTSFIRFVPAADTTVDLGAGSKRWEEVFSVQSSINTSDENEKQQIENLDEVELRVAQRIKGLIRKFKWNSAVENKGDNARIHFGVIAQDLQRAFEAEGLDAEKYGLFCSDTWWEEEVTETDEEGNEKTTIKTYEEYKEGTIEKTRLGVRYTELLAFVIAAL